MKFQFATMKPIAVLGCAWLFSHRGIEGENLVFLDILSDQ